VYQPGKSAGIPVQEDVVDIADNTLYHIFSH
jgi:hypothetical protein